MTLKPTALRGLAAAVALLCSFYAQGANVCGRRQLRRASAARVIQPSVLALGALAMSQPNLVLVAPESTMVESVALASWA